MSGGIAAKLPWYAAPILAGLLGCGPPNPNPTPTPNPNPTPTPVVSPTPTPILTCTILPEEAWTATLLTDSFHADRIADIESIIGDVCGRDPIPSLCTLSQEISLPSHGGYPSVVSDNALFIQKEDLLWEKYEPVDLVTGCWISTRGHTSNVYHRLLPEE